MIYSRIAGMIVFIMLVTSLYKPVFIDTDEIIFGISEDHKQIISTVVEEEELRQLMNLSKVEIHSETDAMFASALDAYRKEQGNKKASNTKDLGLAKTYEQEAKRTLKALDLLEQGMTQSQKGTANGLRLEAQAKANEEFNNSINKTISSLKSYNQELQSVNKEVGFDKLVSKAGENARQEYENMISSANKMQNALNNMLSSGKVDTTNLAKVNDELNKSRNNLDKFKNTSINIKCKEAIADLKE